MNLVIKLKWPINHCHFDSRASDPRPLQLWQVRSSVVAHIYPTRKATFKSRALHRMSINAFPETWQILTLPSYLRHINRRGMIHLLTVKKTPKHPM